LKFLYVTWDAPQATYLESLFLPIFERLGAFGISFDVLQFTWDVGERAAAAADACRRAGIGFDAVEVKRSWGGAGPFLSAFSGAGHVLSHLRRSRADAVLARSTMPAIATLRAARKASFPFAFDADGLPLDERVEFAGRSPSSLQHRFLRDLETQMLQRSSAVLVRTPKAREIMIARAGAGTDEAKFHIVGNGRDPAAFHPHSSEQRMQMRERLGVSPDAPLLVYAGSVGPQYKFQQMLDLLVAVRRQNMDARLLILTGSQDAARQAIRDFAAEQAGACLVATAAPHDVPSYLAAGDVGIALRQPSFSMQGVAPIKIGEYLMCGLPIVGTPGIGDVQEATDSGLFFPVAATEKDLEAAADWILRAAADREASRAAARDLGLRRFSLERSVQDYRLALSGVPPVLAAG
jgi:glycosyltransferase involved in cell wall biosynthesis